MNNIEEDIADAYMPVMRSVFLYSWQVRQVAALILIGVEQPANLMHWIGVLSSGSGNTSTQKRHLDTSSFVTEATNCFN